MKVLVCGANGFVGNAISTHLEQDGHQVIRGVRRPTHPGEISIDYTTDLTADQWLNKLDGVEVVVNAVGIRCAISARGPVLVAGRVDSTPDAAHYIRIGGTGRYCAPIGLLALCTNLGIP